METTVSADGVRIAFDSVGTGPTVLIVGGAFSRAGDGAGLAQALAEQGFRAVTIERRARGESGDRYGSTPDDEVSDVAAVIDAVGGATAVVGHSSGAVLAHYAASKGVPVGALFLSEPPFHFGVDEPGDEFADRLQRLVDEGANEEAVMTFQLEGIGLPREMVEGMRQSGQLAGLLPLAQSTVYDARLTALVSTPTSEMLEVSPTTVLRGAQTFPFLITAADRLAAEMPHAELVVVPESVMHRLDPTATARVIRARA